jgi:hypothetical protein
MFSPKKSKTKKVILICLIFLLLMSVNFGIFDEIAKAKIKGTKKAGTGGTAAAVGTLSCLTNIGVAIWTGGAATVDIRKCIDEILLAVWKAAVYPMLKKMVMSLVTSGDFGITWESIQDWFYYDLVFQTVEAVLNRIGITLCAQFSASIKLALFYSSAPDYYPECKFSDSMIAKTIAEAIQREDWGVIRRDFYRLFHINSQPQYNPFTNYWLAKGLIDSETAIRQDQIRMELTFSGGFLGTRDCEKDKKTGKLKTPEKCRVVTPGAWFAETVFGEFHKVETATLQAQALADLGALTAMAIDTLANQAISGAWSDLTNWFNSQKDDNRNYIKTLEKEAKQTQSATGQNKTIEFPYPKSTYEITPATPTKEEIPSTPLETEEELPIK